MNKRGALFLSIFIGIFIFAMGVLFIPFIVDDITTFRTGMDCTNASISDGSKLSCLGSDLAIPYLIWFFCSIAVGYLLGDKF